MQKRRSKKQEQRDEVIRLIHALRDTLEDSPLGIRRSDLEEIEEQVGQFKGNLQQHEDRLSFLEAKDDQFTTLLKSDIRRMVDEALGQKTEPPKPFWRKIFRRWSH